MKKITIFGACLFFLAVGLLGSASAEESIYVNQYKSFSGGNGGSQFLNVELVAPRASRVQIVVVKEGKILESHRLVVGPQGVTDGKFRGARCWGYVLAEGQKGKGLEAYVFVTPLAGEGDPIHYRLKDYSQTDRNGFSCS